MALRFALPQTTVKTCLNHPITWLEPEVAIEQQTQFVKTMTRLEGDIDIDGLAFNNHLPHLIDEQEKLQI